MIINNTTIAGNPGILLPVLNGILTHYCQQDFCFVCVNYTVDFAGLIMLPNCCASILHVRFYIKLPQMTQVMVNGAGEISASPLGMVPATSAHSHQCRYVPTFSSPAFMMARSSFVLLISTSMMFISTIRWSSMRLSKPKTWSLASCRYWPLDLVALPGAQWPAPCCYQTHLPINARPRWPVCHCYQHQVLSMYAECLMPICHPAYLYLQRVW